MRPQVPTNHISLSYKGRSTQAPHQITTAPFAHQSQSFPLRVAERTFYAAQSSLPHSSLPLPRRNRLDTYNLFSFSNIASSPAPYLHTLANPHRSINASCHLCASAHSLPLTRILGLNKAMHAVSFTASHLPLSSELRSKPTSSIRNSSMQVITQRAQQ